MKTGNFKLNLVQENIIALLKEVYYAFYDHATERKIQYELNIKEKEIFACYDHDQLEKVLFNLLSNAFKFTSNNGTIKLNVDNTNQKWITVAISNTGPTLSKQEQENIFNRFYQQTEDLEDDIIGQLLDYAEGLSLDDDPVTTNADGTPNNTGTVYFRIRAYAGAGTGNNTEIISDIINLNLSVIEQVPTGICDGVLLWEMLW